MAVTDQDGRTLVATGARDGSVLVRDLRTRRPLGTPLRFPAPVKAIAWGTAGRLVVGFGRDLAVLAPQGEPGPDPTTHGRWETAGRPQRPRARSRTIDHLAVRRIGDRDVAFIMDDRDAPDIGRLDLATGALLGTKIHVGPGVAWGVGELDHRPVLAHVRAGARAGVLELADAMTGEPIWRRPVPSRGTPLHLHFAEPHGLSAILIAWSDFAARSQTLEMYGVRLGTPLATVTEGQHVTAFADPGAHALVSDFSEGLRLWDPFGEAAPGPPFGDHQAAAALTLRDGRLLAATGNADGAVELWDPLDGALQEVVAVSRRRSGGRRLLRRRSARPGRRAGRGGCRSPARRASD